MRHYCLGGCSALSVCARRSRPVRGARAGTWCCVSPVCPFPPRVSRADCGPSGCPLPSLAGTPFHALSAFRVLGPVAFLVVPVCPLRVCALALPRRSPPPPLGGVVCAPRAVPALGAGRAVPRGPCPSACPALVPCSVWRAWGGEVRSRVHPTWLGLHALWGLRAAGVMGGRPQGGVACHCCWGRLVSGAFPPLTARPLGRAAGVPRPVCTGRSLCGGGDPAPAPQRALVRAGVARCGAGAVPPPTARPQGRAAGVQRPVCSGCGRCGCGDPAPVPRRAPLRAGVLAVGVAEGRPRGECLPPL